jgi:hypothetical protein
VRMVGVLARNRIGRLPKLRSEPYRYISHLGFSRLLRGENPGMLLGGSSQPYIFVRKKIPSLAYLSFKFQCRYAKHKSPEDRLSSAFLTLLFATNNLTLLQILAC